MTRSCEARKVVRHITINLSAGTPIMQSCWSHLNWQAIAREVAGGTTEDKSSKRVGIRRYDLIDEEHAPELCDTVRVWPIAAPSYTAGSRERGLRRASGGRWSAPRTPR